MIEKKKKEEKGLDLGKLLGGILKGLNIEQLLNAAETLANTKGDERAKEDVRKMREGLGKTKDVTQGDIAASGLGDLFKGILNFVEKASKESGEFTQKFANGKGMIQSGIRGHILGIPLGGKDLPLDRRTPTEKFTVKRHEPKAQRIKKESRSEDEMRQPNLDVFDEKDYILIIGDMPGVNKEDIKYELKEKTLRIYTEAGRKYEKEIELPAMVNTKEIKLSYKNGVLELNLPKQEEAEK